MTFKCMCGCHPALQKCSDCCERVCYCMRCNKVLPCDCFLERVRELDTRVSCLELQIKAKEFKADMDQGERWMECIAGLEDKFEAKLREEINNVIKCFVKEDGVLEDEIISCKKTIDENDADINEHDERICDLENMNCNIRLLKIERCFGSVINSGTTCKISDKLKDKKPHKCPVCDGSASVRHPLTGFMAPAVCHACEGKGIVWG